MTLYILMSFAKIVSWKSITDYLVCENLQYGIRLCIPSRYMESFSYEEIGENIID